MCVYQTQTCGNINHGVGNPNNVIRRRVRRVLNNHRSERNETRSTTMKRN